MNVTALSNEEFTLLRRVIQQQTGMSLADGKRALVESRLRPRVRELGLASFHGYYQRLRDRPDPRELQELVNAITTQTTAFFREAAHFDFVARELVPAWARRARQGAWGVRCWSAACATGEEAYSLAAVVRGSLLEPVRFDARILATDISSRALARVAEARYPLDALEAIPRAYRAGFVPGRLGDARIVEVAEPLRGMVAPRLLNLLSARYPFRGRFELILCRNVLIYFDEPTRAALVERLLCSLAPGGHLILGLSEALLRVPPKLAPLGASIYRYDGA